MIDYARRAALWTRRGLGPMINLSGPDPRERLKAPPVYPLATFRAGAEGLADRLPWLIKGGPTTIITRDLGYQRTFLVLGKDLTHVAIELRSTIGNRAAFALNHLCEEGWTLQSDLDRFEVTLPEPADFPDTASWLVAQEFHRRFKAAVPYASDAYITLTYLPPTDAGSAYRTIAYSYDDPSAAKSAREDRRVFEEGCTSFAKTMSRDFTMVPLGLEQAKDSAGNVFLADRQLQANLFDVTGKRQTVRAVPEGAILSEYLADSLREEDQRVRIGDVFVRPVTILDYPSISFHGALDALDTVEGSFRLHQRFIAMERERALKVIKREYKRNLQKRQDLSSTIMNDIDAIDDPDATQSAGEARDSYGKAKSKRVAHGYFSTSVLCYERIRHDEEYPEDAARARQDALVSNIVGVLHDGGFVTSTELDNTLDVILGSLKGNGRDNVVKGQLGTRTLSAWLPFNRIWRGSLKSAYPEAPDVGPLLILPGSGRTPIGVNINVGNRGGHSLIVGDTGSGKTSLAGLIINQHAKIPNAMQIVVDREEQHIVHCWARDATHVELSPYTDTTLAIFEHIDTPEGFALGEKMIYIFLKRSGINPYEYAEPVIESLMQLRQAPRDYWSVSGLMQTPNVPKDIRKSLHRFSRRGEAGALFDAPYAKFQDARMLVFETDPIYGSELHGPAMVALSYRVRHLARKTMKRILYVTEELWGLLDDPLTQAIVREDLKTLRRSMVDELLLTQSLDDLDRSGMDKSVLNSCATIFVLPNEKANSENAERLQRLGIDEWERTVLQEKAGEPFALMMQGRNRAFLDTTLHPVARATCASTDKGARGKAREFKAEFGGDWYPEFISHAFNAQTPEEAAIAESWRRHGYFGPPPAPSRAFVGAPAHDAPHPDDPFARFIDAPDAAIASAS